MRVQVDLNPDERVCQGDLIRNVAFVEDIIEEKDEIVEIRRIVFPLVIVLTQDCDLQQDDTIRCWREKPPTNQGGQLLSVLAAPAYNATHFVLGDHLSDLGMKMWIVSPASSKKESTDRKNLEQNKNPRYHHMAFDPSTGIVDSVIDFKHYFSVNVQYLRRIKPRNFAGKLSTLYREDVSQRFASFLARIGLPNP
jgi:hypothetical protein